MEKPNQRPKRRIPGLSYAQRVAEVNRIYDEYCHTGLSNREILRRYIWPRFHISEKTFYNIINASARPEVKSLQQAEHRQLRLDLFASGDGNNEE